MTNEDIFTELWYEAHNLNITEKVREQYINEIDKKYPTYGPRDYGEKVEVLQNVIKNIKENMAKYKIEITPLHSDTGERPELPYVIELQTDDIEWSMDQYQRNRKPFEWKVLL